VLGTAVFGVLAYSYGKAKGLRQIDEIRRSTPPPTPVGEPLYTTEPVLWVED